ncbi:MAG: DUF3597 domain-containing protein [Chthoniobacterales bacterium]
MKLFNTLMSKIFSHAPAPAQTTSAPAGASTQPAAGAPAQTAASAGSTPPSASNAPAASGGAAAAPANVDVDAVLTQMAAKNPERLDWKKSIVDLMKLVGMESSLQNRKELATELGYTGDMNDSASMNIWLHKAVLRKLAENGGRVPKELID